MPVYEYRCLECGEDVEIVHPISELYAQRLHSCGSVMVRLVSMFNFSFPVSNRSRVLKALNGEVALPTTPSDRPRLERALAKGLNREKPVIGIGRR